MSHVKQANIEWLALDSRRARFVQHMLATLEYVLDHTASVTEKGDQRLHGKSSRGKECEALWRSRHAMWKVVTPKLLTFEAL